MNKTCEQCGTPFVSIRSNDRFCSNSCKVKEYYEKNKAAIAASKKKYYEKNKAAIAASKKKYREKNKAAIAASEKEYREKNKAALAASKKKYNEKNKAAIAASKKKYYEKNKAAVAASEKEYREKNKAAIAASKKKYYEKNKAAIAARDKKGRLKKRNQELASRPDRHCLNCHSTIPITARSDQTFCSQKCRNNHLYHKDKTGDAAFFEIIAATNTLSEILTNNPTKTYQSLKNEKHH